MAGSSFWLGYLIGLGQEAQNRRLRAETPLRVNEGIMVLLLSDPVGFVRTCLLERPLGEKPLPPGALKSTI